MIKMKFTFKSEKDYDSRKKMSDEILKDNPDKVPIVLEKDPTCKVEPLKKKNYLLEKKLTISQFIIKIRSKIKIREQEALFLEAKGKYAVYGEQLIGELYNSFKDDDGFLYIMYTTELIYG